MKAVQTYGSPIASDPITALLEELARTAGAVAWLELMVRDLAPEQAAASAWVELYRQERRHLVDVAGVAVRSGIAERQVRIHEQQGALVAALILRLLDLPELELRDDQRRLARAFVSRELHVLEALPAPPSDG
jgi:hypothetical protein